MDVLAKRPFYPTAINNSGGRKNEFYSSENDF